MQPLTAAPRDHLTDSQVRDLIRGIGSVRYRSGLDLLDNTDTFVEDISDVLVRDGSKVDCGVYRDLHRSAILKLSDELDWGTSRLRPWMEIVDVASDVVARFHLGVYLPETPSEPVGSSKPVWTVECYDKLHLLDTPIGTTWSVSAGTGVLAAVAALIADAGETKVKIGASGDDTPLPSGRTWPVAAENTYRRAVNDLLGMVNRQGVWTDWDGWFRSSSYQAPSERGAEWDYDTSEEKTRIVGTDLLVVKDWYDIPNVWIGKRRDDAQQGEPSDGDGLHTETNEDEGPTSINARGGRVVREVFESDAADQASLVAAVQARRAADVALTTLVELTTAPNPAHWHMDVAGLTHAAGLSGRWLVQNWDLPLNGQDMAHKFRSVS